MKKEMLLQNTAKGIVAHHLVDGRPDPKIVRLFGTHILPTPYHALTSLTARQLSEKISELNPGVLVGWI